MVGEIERLRSCGGPCPKMEVTTLESHAEKDKDQGAGGGVEEAAAYAALVTF